MDSIDASEAQALLQTFFREHVMPRRRPLIERGSNDSFAASVPATASYFVAPAIAEPKRSDFETPEPTTIEELAIALEEMWARSEVSLDAEFVRRLAALAFRLKSDDEFGAEPPPFIYTL